MHPMLNIAIRAARRAGDIIVRNMDRAHDLPVDIKGRRDYVSQVDRDAENAIIDVLHKAYPDHEILAEESGSHGHSDHAWIIDPLDGTTNFLHGYPQFAISIALRVKGALDQGVVYDPTRDELFTASRGAGALLNNRRIRASKVHKLEQALLATGFPFRTEAMVRPYLRGFESLMRECAGIRRAGAAALDLAYVACGRVDGFWEYGLKPWDIAAGALLVSEAGGIVGGIAEREVLKTGDIIAANAAIYQHLSHIVNQCDKADVTVREAD